MSHAEVIPTDEADGEFLSACFRRIHLKREVILREIVLLGINLIRKKESLPHGAFTPFIEQHCEFSPRMARYYMAGVRRLMDEQTKKRRGLLNAAAEKLRHGGLLSLTDENALAQALNGRETVRDLLGLCLGPVLPENNTSPAAGEKEDPQMRLKLEREDARRRADELGREVDRFLRMGRQTHLTKSQRKTLAESLRSAAENLEKTL